MTELLSATPKRRERVAEYLSSISESFFADRKIPTVVRAELIAEISLLRDDPVVGVRRCVAQLAGLAEYPSLETEELLAHLLMDLDTQVRVRAAWASGAVGVATRRFWQILLNHSNDPEREVRWRVVWALQKIEPCQEVDDFYLLRMFGDSVDLVVLYGFQLARRSVKSPSPAIRHAVSSALDNINAGTGPACDVVCEVPGEWESVKAKLLKLVVSAPHGIQASAVRALLKRFPATRLMPEVSEWMTRNPGYWWVEESQFT